MYSGSWAQFGRKIGDCGLSQRARGFHSPLPSGEGPGVREEFEERWTGGYIFENEWQSFRTRQNRKLELTSAPHVYTDRKSVV